ncbi:MAG: T9SS C-terminal target domain-containing protein [Chitinophagaceae bacterium]|nr:MAG: T9SS C-terminal target domain-containing protein [Chitinophagaceae bacterium]
MKKNLFILCSLLISNFLWAQYPLVSINDLQFVDQQSLAAGNNESAYLGDTVQVEGVVMFDPCAYALSGTQSRIGTWLQDEQNPGPWSGIHVLIDPGALQGYTGSLSDLDQSVNFIDNFQVGNKVVATGVVTQFSGYTQIVLLPVASQVTGFSALPSPNSASISDFMISDGAGGQIQQLSTGEPYSGTLILLENVRVVDVSAGTGGATGRYFWSVQDNSGNKMQIRDVSGFIRNTDTDEFCTGSTYTPGTFSPPNLNALLDTLQGMVVEFDGNYYIAPRTLSDIGNVMASPPIISNIKRNPIVASSSDNVTITATVIDTDGSVDNVDLMYSFGWGNTNYQSIAMSQTGSTDEWSGQIPATGSDSTYVNFYIVAEDNDGNETVFPDPAVTSSFYYVINAGISDISIIQNTPLPNGNSIWEGDTLKNIDIRGVVTASDKQYDLGQVAIQDGNSPWSGIFVQGDGVSNLLRGDSIQITQAFVREQFGLTILQNVSFTLISSQNDIPEPVLGLNPDSINLQVISQGEAYEGMLIGFENAFVVNKNADEPQNFGEFVINTDENALSGLRVDDRSNNLPFGFNMDSLEIGDEFDYIYGILSYTFSNFKLWPRNLADIDGYNTEYPKRITSFLFLDLSPVAAGSINQQTDSISIVVPEGTDVTSLTPTIEFQGQSVFPESGTVNDFSTPKEYTVTAPIDMTTRTYTVSVEVVVSVQELLEKTISFYPNPAKERVNISWYQNEQEDVELSLYDINGKRVFNSVRSFMPGPANTAIQLWNLNTGVYILKIQSKDAVYSHRIQVVR